MAKPTGKITFAPQPIKFGPQWHVVGTYPDGQQEHITGFKTEADALDWLRTQPSRPRARVRGCYFGEIPISASSRIAVSVARPLSVGVYAPFSRLCAMNPRMATDCIACARMPAAPWSMPVATQNKITRSCALSFVVGFSIVYYRRQLWAKTASSPLRASACRQRQSLGFELTSDR